MPFFDPRQTAPQTATAAVAAVAAATQLPDAPLATGGTARIPIRRKEGWSEWMAGSLQKRNKIATADCERDEQKKTLKASVDLWTCL